jgi:hypothetical protein
VVVAFFGSLKPAHCRSERSDYEGRLSSRNVGGRSKSGLPRNSEEGSVISAGLISRIHLRKAMFAIGLGPGMAGAPAKVGPPPVWSARRTRKE